MYIIIVNSNREEVKSRVIGTGLAASAGGALGKIVFTNEEATELAAKGQSCILCRHDTSADDIAGLKVRTQPLLLRNFLSIFLTIKYRLLKAY